MLMQTRRLNLIFLAGSSCPTALTLLLPMQLILEVVGQLQRMFNPDLRMIKKRIEDLISREYIERDPVRCRLCMYLSARTAKAMRPLSAA